MAELPQDPTQRSIELIKREIMHLKELAFLEISALKRASEKSDDGQAEAARQLAVAVDKTEQRVREQVDQLKQTLEVRIETIGALTGSISEKVVQVDRDRHDYTSQELFDAYAKDQASRADVLAGAIVKGQQDARILAESLAKSTVEQASALSLALDKRTDAVDERLSRVEKTYLPREVFDSLIGAWSVWRGTVDLKLQALEVSDSERLRLAGQGNQAKQMNFAIIFGVIGAMVGVVGLILALTQ